MSRFIKQSLKLPVCHFLNVTEWIKRKLKRSTPLTPQINDNQLMKRTLWILICKLISLSFNYLWGRNGKVYVWRERNLAEGDIAKENNLVVIGVTNAEKKQNKKVIWQFVSAAVSAASWTTYEMRKLSENEVDTLKKKKKKCSSAPTKGRTHQWESRDAGACSPWWLSIIGRLPHQWCCSTEGSRHLCTPVGIRIIA